jgi:hypothetical protein
MGFAQLDPLYGVGIKIRPLHSVKQLFLMIRIHYDKDLLSPFTAFYAF